MRNYIKYLKANAQCILGIIVLYMVVMYCSYEIIK